MIYIYIFFCAFFAPFTPTLQIQHQLTDDYSQDVLQTPRDQAPDYDVISVDHSLHKRNIHELSVKAVINGTEREIILQCVKGFLVGKDTKVWLAEKDPSNGNKFKYTLVPNIMEEVNATFYHDEKTKSTITQTVNEKGISELNGIIDSDKIIHPLKSVKRKRRDVTPESLHESIDDDLKNYHIIYKRAIVPIEDLQQPSSGGIKSEEKKNESNSSVHIVYPEILIYVDTTLFDFFERDVKKTVAYTLTLWYGVDLNFREMENPTVRLNIAGIVLCQDQIIPMNPFKVYNITVLDKFGEFMYSEDKFKLREDYDIAALLAADPKHISGTAGYAYVGGACLSNNNKIESAMVVLDNTHWSATDTASHELGHIFGAGHDGEPGAEDCPKSDGFLMSYESNDYRQFYFSPCTKKKMSLLFSKEEANCLRNDPSVNRTDEQILRVLPGKLLSLDEQCQRMGYLKAYGVNPDICLGITCLEGTRFEDGMAKSSFMTFNKPALEGTPCDFGKFCLRGECVKVALNEKVDKEGPKILFPPAYHLTLPGLNKSSTEQCKDKGFPNITSASFIDCYLKCQYHTGLENEIYFNTGLAEDGTPCGISGYCQRGTCVEGVRDTTSTLPTETTSATTTTTESNNEPNEIETGDSPDDNELKIANEYCKNAGGLGASKVSPTDCIINCKKSSSNFMNEHPFRKEDYFQINARDGLSCSNNGFCQNGKCIGGLTENPDSTSIPDGTGKPVHTTLPDDSVFSLNSSVTPFDDITTVSSDNPKGSTALNNNATPEDTTLSNETTSATNTTTESNIEPNKIEIESPSPPKDYQLELANEYCKQKGGEAAIKVTDCAIYCKKFPSTFMDDYLFKEEESFSKGENYYLIKTRDGAPCTNKGYCQNGKCIRNETENPDSPTISEGSIEPNKIEIESPSPPKDYQLELANDYCKHKGGVAAIKVTDCAIYCKEFPSIFMDDYLFNGEEYFPQGENYYLIKTRDGAPCTNKGYCQNGKCIRNETENPDNTTIPEGSGEPAHTTLPHDSESSSGNSVTPFDSITTVSSDIPKGSTALNNNATPEDTTLSDKTISATITTTESNNEPKGITTHDSTTLDSHAPSETTKLPNETTTSVVTTTILSIIEPNKQNCKDGKCIKGDSENPDSTTIPEVTGKPAHTTLPHDSESSSGTSVTPFDSITTVSSDNPKGSTAINNNATPEDTTLSNKSTSTTTTTTESIKEPNEIETEGSPEDDELKKADKYCKNKERPNAYAVSKTDCIIHCKMFDSGFMNDSDSEGNNDSFREKEYYSIQATDGDRCSNNGECQKGECIRNQIENPDITTIPEVTGKPVHTTLPHDSESSSGNSVTPFDSITTVSSDNPKGSTALNNNATPGDTTLSNKTTSATITTTESNNEPNGITTHNSTTLDSHAPSETTKLPNETTTSVITTTILSIIEPNKQNCKDGKCIKGDSENPDSTTIPEVTGKPAHTTLPHDSESSSGNSVTPFDSITTVSSDNPEGSTALNNNATPEDTTLSDKTISATITTTESNNEPKGITTHDSTTLDSHAPSETTKLHNETTTSIITTTILSIIEPNKQNCKDGKCIKGDSENTDSTTVSNHVAHPVETDEPEIPLSAKLKFADEECKKAGTLGVLKKNEFFTDDCIFDCKLHDEDPNSLTRILWAPNGSSCNDTGYCQNGYCVMDGKTQNTTKILDSTTIDSNTTEDTIVPDKISSSSTTTTSRNIVSNENTSIQFDYTTPINHNIQEVTDIPMAGPMLSMGALFYLADTECKKFGFFGAFELSPTDCVLHCKTFPDFYESYVSYRESLYLPVYAQDGFPCRNVGICMNNICMDGRA